MRIRFKALSPNDEDLSKTRPEGPAARQRVSEKAPKAGAEAAPDAAPARSDPPAGRPKKERAAVPRVVEPPTPPPKRRDPRRD